MRRKKKNVAATVAIKKKMLEENDELVDDNVISLFSMEPKKAAAKAKLCLEAELAYATLAMATDYDCWHEGHDDVTVEAILEVMAKNVDNAKNVIRAAEKYVSKGKLEAAIKEYRKVLAENPNDTNTLNRVGDLYARAGKPGEAIKLFSQMGVDLFARMKEQT